MSLQDFKALSLYRVEAQKKQKLFTLTLQRAKAKS
jgi:hypothetical protein